MKRKGMSRALAGVLAAALVVTALPAGAVTAYADDTGTAETGGGAGTTESGQTPSIVDFQAMDDKVLSLYSGWTGCPETRSEFGSYMIKQGDAVTANDGTVSVAVKVTGTAKYVTGFTGFNTAKTEEQAGYYIPLQFLASMTELKSDVATAAAFSVALENAKGQSPFTEKSLDKVTYGDTSGYYFSIINRVNPSKAKDTDKITFVVDLDGDGKEYSGVKYTLDYSEVKFETTLEAAADMTKSFKLNVANDKDSGATASVKKSVKMETVYGDITTNTVTWYEGDFTSTDVDESKKIEGDFTKIGTYTYVAKVDPDSVYTGSAKGKIEVTQGDASITATTTSITDVKYGDEPFSIADKAGFTVVGDGKLTYTVTESKDSDGTATSEQTDIITVDESGVVTVNKAGPAKITVSMEATDNYSAPTSGVEITLTIGKATAPDNLEVEKFYKAGTEKSDTVNIADYLAGLERGGDPTCTVGDDVTDTNNILATGSDAPAIAESSTELTYKVASSATDGQTATIPVTVKSNNYADFTVTVKITMTNKTPAVLKDGVDLTPSNSLTYGDKLEKIVLDATDKFVSSENSETAVTGTLAWADDTATPNAGTVSVKWTFTPSEESATTYEGCSGNVWITVDKATPIPTAPTVEAVTYSPSQKLSEISFNNDGSAKWTVGDTEKTVNGTWAWQTGDTVPTVGNEGYTAVFTPSGDDAANYNTVTETVSVNVNKATPVIKTAPTAAAITYGQKVSDAALSGGAAQHSADVNTAVAGSFAWSSTDKDTIPAVSDSGKTEYTVEFTPSDATNYEKATKKITITVNKATAVPGAPEKTMSVANSVTKVSDVTTLPANWTWEDGTIALTAGTAVNAVAVYNGTDKDNYTDEACKVTVAITRASSSGGGGGGTGGGGGSSSTTTGGTTGGTATDDPATVTNPDGSTTTTNKDGSTTTTNVDGSTVETSAPASGTNAAGKETVVVTTTEKDAAGNVTSVTTTTEIPKSSSNTSTVVSATKDAATGEVAAEAEIAKTIGSDSKKSSISGTLVAQITEAAGTDSVAITMEVKGEDGSTKYTLKVNTEDMVPEGELYIYKLNAKGEYVMVNAKTYTVSEAGSVSVSMSKNATYELVNAEKSAEITKAIKATIKPKKANATVKVGKKTTIALKSGYDKDNIKSITYSTTKKSVATVNKNGKVTAKKKGTVTIKAKVTLKNGSTKTVKMKVKVK